MSIKNFIVLTCVCVLLGCLSSCSMAYESYDLDCSDYEIRGVVRDAETYDIIKGMRVTLFEAFENDDQVYMGHKLDSLEVTTNGEFVFSGRSYGGVPECKFIRVSDLDKDLFGHYQTKIFKLELSELDKISTYSPSIYGALNLFLDIDKVPSAE